MKTYTLSFADSLNHIPNDPMRTAYRNVGTGLNFDVTYREFSNRAAMKKCIELQERGEPSRFTWKDWYTSRYAAHVGSATDRAKKISDEAVDHNCKAASDKGE